MRINKVSIDFAEMVFVITALVLGILGIVDWWIVGLFILSKFKMKFTLKL